MNNFIKKYLKIQYDLGILTREEILEKYPQMEEYLDEE